MSLRELQPPDRYQAPLPTSYLAEEGQKIWPVAELLRLSGAAAAVTVLVVGGVYWLRLQVAGGSAEQQQASIVQVRLMPRSEPAIPAAPTPHSVIEKAASSADTPLNEPDPMLEPSIAMPRVKAYAPAEAPPVTSGLNPSVTGGTADSVALKFRQALLRHVARFQRYPNAAGEPDPEGKVDVRFSMDRDGMLLGVWVTTGSGPSVLDREAIETIRRAQPLPPIPRELPDRLNVHLQLVFAPS